MDRQKLIGHAMMTFTVFMWGIEYIAAKFALTAFSAMTIIMLKYCIASFILGGYKFFTGQRGFIKRKDILTFLFVAVLGELLYFYCEYSAMDYLPVGLVTVVLALVPVASIITERIFFGRKPTVKMIIGIIACLGGIVLIIGVDLEQVLSGQFIGYLFCLMAVCCWNAYNFITEKIGEDYSDANLTFNQMVSALILCSPLGIAQFPGFAVFEDWRVLFGILFLGIMSAGIGFLFYVSSLKRLGPTIMSVYSNFMPVTTAFFGWVILKEYLSPMQLLGMAIVIAAGLLVILDKSRLDDADK